MSENPLRDLPDLFATSAANGEVAGLTEDQLLHAHDRRKNIADHQRRIEEFQADSPHALHTAVPAKQVG
jgi:hypothetical protein